jgi:hypothetical protein
MIKLKPLLPENDLSKDIHHVIGNSVFAIETNLEALKRRVLQNKTEETLKIIDDITVSINKNFLIDTK